MEVLEKVKRLVLILSLVVAFLFLGFMLAGRFGGVGPFSSDYELTGFSFGPSPNVDNGVDPAAFVNAVVGGPSLSQQESGSVAKQDSKAKLESVRKNESDDEPLVSLGRNDNGEIPESSGLAVSSFLPNAIWTHNDSGRAAQLYLLRTDGKLLAKVDLSGSKNLDWEAMTRFQINGKPYLMIGDVGDNRNRRKSCKLYFFSEPDLSSRVSEKNARLPLETRVQCESLEFAYPDGPRNCEAIAIDQSGSQLWLVEKVYVDSAQKTPPGVYVLPLANIGRGKNRGQADPIVAKRIANFPIRNVTGMDFSPDGKRLIIRNYVNAHMYSREGIETWEETFNTTNPETVVLPLQRQGEAVCFTKDSKALILTSELTRQPIWQVSLAEYFKRPRRMKKSKKLKEPAK